MDDGRGMAGVTLVLGGVRSGKSRHAEALVMRDPGPWIYLATGRAFDGEMHARITAHRAGRDARWVTQEEPVAVARVLRDAGRAPVLLDCLTLWLTNLLLDGADIEDFVSDLLSALRAREGTTVLVGNEVGLGIVPQNRLARRFRDEAGLLHQRIAAEAGGCVLVAAGLALMLKG